MAEATIFYIGPIVTREEASKVSAKQFFNGKECRSGHVALRHVRDGRCVICRAKSKADEYKRNKSDRLAQQKEYRTANVKEIQAKRRVYRCENGETIRRRARSHYAAHREEINDYNRQYALATKPQRQAAAKAWRERNADKIKNDKKLYRAANRERIAAVKRKQYLANSAAIKARVKQWCKENRESRRQIALRWTKSHPDYSRAAAAKRRSSRKEGGVQAEDLGRIMKSQRGRCAICREKLHGGHHIDHIIPIKLGGTSEAKNLQMLCPPCNRSKGAKDPIKFMQERGFLL